MATWGEFAAREPAMADAGRLLLYQFGPELAFLATLRGDGAPRIHPICPVIEGEALFAFLVDSPKRRDLARDGRYALHAFPPESVDDVFTLAGRAAAVEDPTVREHVEAAYREQVDDDSNLPAYGLFTFGIERGLLSTYRHRGDWPPIYTIWRDEGSVG